MGNQHSAPPRAHVTDVLSQDLPNLVVKTNATAPGGRFLKSITCRVDDDEGTDEHPGTSLALVKVYVKRPGRFPDLRRHEREIDLIYAALTRGDAAPHCWPYTRALETSRAVYLMRQYCHMTLYDRLSARPFLSECERAWVAYQVLLATRDSHAVGVTHGDIKCENVLMTSWGWCFLSDYASYKPSEIPVDNPSEFTYFFDSGGRRRCCIAPERFSNENRSRSLETMLDETPTKVDPSADIFALGCTLAELFMDGKALFDLSEALQYRRGEYDPREALEAGVKVDLARQMIMSMVSIDPSARLSAREYLEQYYRSRLFPSYFERVHEFSAQFLHLDANGKIDAIDAELDDLLATIVRVESGMDAIERASTTEDAVAMAMKSRVKCPGVHLVAAHVCSAIRGATLVSARVRALKLLRRLSVIATDECVLQLMLPFCVSSLQDAAAIVRAEALRAIADILTAVNEVPQSEFGLFREYIWPILSNAASDSEILVRIALGEVLAELARLSVEFLQRAVASGGVGGNPISFDDEMLVIRNTVRNVILSMLTPEHRNGKSPVAEKAMYEVLLVNSPQLAEFFGRDDANNFLMPLLITCLNSPSPQLRCEFFKHIAGVGRVVGRASCELVLVPCVDRCLLDVQDAVVSCALRCMTTLIAPDVREKPQRAEVASLGKHAIVSIAKSAAPLMCHPSTTVRNAAFEFFATAARCMGVVDAFTSLSPVVAPFVDASEPNRAKLLRVAPEYLSQPDVLAMCVYPPPSRSAFEAALEQATGLRTAAVFAAARARIDRPSDLENQDPEDNVHGGYSARDDDADAASLKAMMSYIKALANARRLRSSASPSEGAASQQTKPTRNRSSRPPSFIDEGDTYMSDSDVNDAWSTIFGAKTPLVVPQDARVISLRETRENRGVDVASGSVVDALSAAVKNMGVNRFKSIGGAPEADTAATTSMSDDDAWTPRGVLVAHLLEHRGAVSSIAVDRGEVFFVTGSDDGSCKIWDSRRIEKDVSFKSRLTYASQGGKVTCVASTSDSHIVSGSDNGTVHAWRVEYTTRDATKSAGKQVPDKYTGAAEIRHVNKLEGAIAALACLDEHVVCYVTQSGGVYGWDYRAPRDAFRIPLNPKLGVVSSIALDAQHTSSWLVASTASGAMSLLDMRFQTIVQEWSHPSRGVGVDAMVVATQPTRQSLSGVIGRPLVWCAAGYDEVALWDVADGGCLRILRTLRGQGAALDAAARAPPSAMDANGRLRALRSQSAHVYSSTLTSSAYGTFSEDLRADELLSTVSRPPGVRALLTLPNGAIVSGSTDACIRVWHPGDAAKSRVMSGKISGPRPKFSEKSFNGVVLQQETPVPAKPQTQASAAHERHDSHRDAVLALATISGTSGKMLISASRDMSVKLWK